MNSLIDMPYMAACNAASLCNSGPILTLSEPLKGFMGSRLSC